jgi:2'-5' RNA ligase
MAEKQQTIRAFIAIELPDSVKRFLGDVQNRLRAASINCRWVKPANIHLTLKFLGDVAPDRLDDIHAALNAAAAGQAPFKIQARGFGGFPNLRRPRVLWIGLDDQTNRLADLQKRLDGNLADIGFESEKRPFKGHLTLGRAKGRIDTAQLEPIADTINETASATFQIDDIALFKSVLQPAGAVYTLLDRSSLSDA